MLRFAARLCFIRTFWSKREDRLLDDTQLKKSFEVWWNQIKDTLDKIEDPSPKDSKKDTTSKEEAGQGAILEELLELARNQQKLLRSPEILLPPDYLDFVFGRTSFKASSGRTPEWDLIHKSTIKLESLVKELSDDNPLHLEIQAQVRRMHNTIHSLLSSRAPTRRIRSSLRNDDEQSSILD